MPTPPFDREVLFLGGKGGVGKTTLAACLALASASRERRTLLVSTDPAHSTSDALGCTLGNEATAVRPNLWAVEIDPAEEADRYISEVKRRVADATPPRLAAEVERQIDIARVTPGADESALFDRFTRLLDELGSAYERIVFDTAPLGHTLRLLSLPELMNVWIDGLVDRRKKVNVLGRMWRRVAGSGQGSVEAHDPILGALQERQQRFQRARVLITDAARTGFVFVVIPELLPVAETERSIDVLNRNAIPVAAVVVNQRFQGNDQARLDREQQYVDRVRSRFSSHPIAEIPRLDIEPHGMPGLQVLLDAIPSSMFEG